MMLCLRPYDQAVARTKDPAVRKLLVERAGHLLRTREPITLRSLVAGTGVSTMAVYTWFGGMDGVWSALRQEGFTRLGDRFAALAPTADPVQDLTMLVCAYLRNALDHPDLYRVMFEADFALEDGEAAQATLEHLVAAAERGRKAQRFRNDVDPRELAVQCWVVVHGLVSLVANGPLPPAALGHGQELLAALLTSAGDDAFACRASIARGWNTIRPDGT